MENQNLNRVIIGNARTAYFMVFVSWLFLLNKNNPNLNHPFVHAHTKSAMIVHLGFLLTYIICVHYGAGETISILSWQLNYLLASTVFLGLFCSSLYGMYLAGQEKTFHVGELIQVSRDSKILDVHESTSHDEKDMFLIILSYIPFIGYLQYAKYKSSETIQNATKLNLLSTIIIIATYIAGNTNLAIFLLLLYIISVAFISVSLIGSKRLLTLQLRQIPTPGEIPVYLRSFWKYLTQKHETFSEFKNLYKQEQEAEQQEEENWKGITQTLTPYKLPKFCLYLPIVNICNLFFLKTNARTHIINGLGITFITILIWTFHFSPSYYLLLFIPICYGIGYAANSNTYRLPGIFSLYTLIAKIVSKVWQLCTTAKRLHKKHETSTGKVKETSVEAEKMQ